MSKTKRVCTIPQSRKAVAARCMNAVLMQTACMLTKPSTIRHIIRSAALLQELNIPNETYYEMLWEQMHRRLGRIEQETLVVQQMLQELSNISAKSNALERARKKK